MHSKKKNQKKEKSAMTLSLYGNLFFVIIELIMAIYTSSQAVLLDAVYDGIEFFMLLPSIFLIPLLYRPMSEKHPFGYVQVESFFMVIKGITMTAVTIGLIINNINIALHGGSHISFNSVAYFELFACILGAIVTILLKKKNRKVNSPLVNLEIQGWEIDSIVSFGMTIAFFLPIFLENTIFNTFSPYLDQLITVLLSLFIIPTPIKSVITGFRDLMLLPPEEATVEDIKKTVDSILSSYGFENLYYDIVRTGRRLWISVYITFDRDDISIQRFQKLQAECIKALSFNYNNFYFELLPDIEFKKSSQK